MKTLKGLIDQDAYETKKISKISINNNPDIIVIIHRR